MTSLSQSHPRTHSPTRAPISSASFHFHIAADQRHATDDAILLSRLIFHPTARSLRALTRLLRNWISSLRTAVAAIRERDDGRLHSKLGRQLFFAVRSLYPRTHHDRDQSSCRSTSSPAVADCEIWSPSIWSLPSLFPLDSLSRPSSLSSDLIFVANWFFVSLWYMFLWFAGNDPFFFYTICDIFCWNICRF